MYDYDMFHCSTLALISGFIIRSWSSRLTKNFRDNRFCFGIASAPAIFQGIIEQILQPSKGVQPYLDYIALKGINDRDHLKVLRHT